MGVTCLRDLEKLAVAQGWTVTPTARDGRLFRSPDGIHSVATAQRLKDRALKNVIAQLRRAGLDIPRPGSSRKEKQLTSNGTQPTQPVDREMADALDAAIQMIEELASDFTRFRDHVSKELAAIRGKQQALEERVAQTVGADAGIRRELDEMSREFDRRLDEIARKADPIGTFRAKLRGQS